MAELRAFFVNPSKIPDEPLEVVFAHCALISLSLTEKRAKAEICHDNILKLEDIYSNICEN